MSESLLTGIGSLGGRSAPLCFVIALLCLYAVGLLYLSELFCSATLLGCVVSVFSYKIFLSFRKGLLDYFDEMTY